MTRREYIAIGITILLVCLVVFIEYRPIVYPMTITKQKEYNAKWGINDYRNGFACPICKSDSVDTLKYGYGVGACGIGRETKQYRCRQCDYEWGLLPEFKKNRGRAFNELTLSDDGFYVMDVDFDGGNDIVIIKDGEAKVYRFDPTIWRSKNVSKQVPYCFLAAHLCCNAHKAFTTFNYSTKTIYIEAHSGSGDINTSIRQFQKIGEEWKEVIPVTPSYIINKDLFPRNHINYIGGRRIHWGWRDNKGGFSYIVR